MDVRVDYKESWAPKNWCFWTVVLEKTLESSLDSKEIQWLHLKGNQSWIFIGRTNAKLKLQYFGHLMQRANSMEKTLMLGKIEGRKRWGWQRIRWLDGSIDSMDMSLSKHCEIVKNREAWDEQQKWSMKLVAQLCLTLWDPMDCSIPDSSVHGILQARVLEWVVV